MVSRRKLPPWLFPVLRAVLVLLCPLACVLACQLVTQESLSQALDQMLRFPKAVLMYYAVLLLGQLVIAGFTRLSGLGGLLAALLPLALSLASYYKSAINGDPLALSDLGLAGQLGDIAGFASANVTVTPAIWLALACVIVPAVLLTVLDIRSLLGRDAFRPTVLQGLALAAAGGAALAAFVPLALRPYCVEQFKAYPVQAARDPRLGVPLSLLSAWYCSQPAPSAGYSEARMEAILEDMEDALARQEVKEDRPHILFVMNESFFDITRLEGLAFSQDPLPNYHRLSQEATYGRFYTITCGGGTGCVEMEAFTGVAQEELDNSTANTDLSAGAYGAMPSYVRVLKENGYRTIAFHAHTNALYHREENYPRLGFDQVLFHESFLEGATFSGGYFDDGSAAGVILSLFEENRDQPLLLYTMTMQNHQPYFAGRYPREAVRVTSPLLSQEELEGVTCYTTGLYDADRMLGRLVDYFSQVDEPVILVFAGDHVPALPLGSGESVYTRLGIVPTASSTGWSAEDYQAMMATDYLIWTNCRQPAGERVSGTTAIGGTLLELAGARSTPFFAWMAQNSRETMAFHARLLTVEPDGSLASPGDPDIRDFRAAYTDVVYDLLYGEGYIAQGSSAVPAAG